MNSMLKNKKICNFASPSPGCIGSVQQTPQQRIRVNPLLLVNTFGYSQSPSSGDSGAGSRRRPRCLPAACWQPSGLRWPEARGWRAGHNTASYQHSSDCLVLQEWQVECRSFGRRPVRRPRPAAGGLRAANHCFHPVHSSSRALFTLCSAVIWSNFLVHSSSVTG